MSTTEAPTLTPTKPRTTAMPADADDAKIGEAEFLSQEADKAKAAIAESLNAIGRSLARAADPHRLTHDHPWLAVGAAAVAGFATAVTLVPSKEQQTLKALAAIERSLNAPPVTEEKKPDKKEAGAAGGLIGIVLAEILKLLRPLLTGLVTNAMGGGSDDAKADAASKSDVDLNEAPGISAPS